MNIIRRVKGKSIRIIDYIYDALLYWCLGATSGFWGKCILRFFKRNRKIVGFYGECHIYIYGGVLRSIREVKKSYVLLGTKEIEYLARWHASSIIRKSSWDKLDVLIYNSRVPNREGAPSLNQVLEWVPKTCKKIEVTNAAFKGYMPQHTERVFKNTGFFIWGDKNLNKLVKEGKSIDDIQLDNLYSSQYVNDYFDKAVKHLKIYERETTVKIADYIEKYGRERVLYYSVTHPETEIMLELVRRILKELGIDTGNTECVIPNDQFDLHSHGEVVYPCVYSGLGIIENPMSRIIQPGNYKEIQYTFKEYVDEYIKMAEEASAKGAWLNKNNE